MFPEPPFISIIIPVKNEERILGRCLDAIGRLVYPKDRMEVIVADSLSTDASRQIARQWGAQVVANPRQTVVSGRNCGFQVARGEFVAFTDADCMVSPDWLKIGLQAFQLDDAIAGVGGVTRFPDDATSFQKAVNVLFLLAGLTGSTAHLDSVPSTRYVADIPGCNSIYRRSALEKVMPLDENLLTAEDVWLNWQLRKHGFKQLLAECMVLWHHRRSTPRSFFLQIYRFAIGRLQVGKRAPGLLKRVHVAVGLSMPLAMSAALVAILWGHSAALVAVVFAACAALFLLSVIKTRSVPVASLTPVVFGIFLTAWSFGFMRELLFPMSSVDGK